MNQIKFTIYLKYRESADAEELSENIQEKAIYRERRDGVGYVIHCGTFRNSILSQL